jgi:hypothetical protein
MYTLYDTQSGTSYGERAGRIGGNRGTLYNDSRQTDYLNGYVAPNLRPIENPFPPISGFIPNANGDSFDSAVLAGVSGVLSGGGVVVSVDHGPSMAPIQINSHEGAEMVFGTPLPGAGVSGSFGSSMDAAQANLMAQIMSDQISEMGLPVGDVSVQYDADGNFMDVSFVAEPVTPINHINIGASLQAHFSDEVAYDLSNESIEEFLESVDLDNLSPDMYDILTELINQAANTQGGQDI